MTSRRWAAAETGRYDTPTQEGYQQMMRQKSMAAHPAGKARG